VTEPSVPLPSLSHWAAAKGRGRASVRAPSCSCTKLATGCYGFRVETMSQAGTRYRAGGARSGPVRREKPRTEFGRSIPSSANIRLNPVGNNFVVEARAG
jgi:hypothetical protein